VFAKKVADQHFESLIRIDSAGTSDWHSGSKPDSRATAAAANKGYDLSSLRARSVTVDDFDQFDFILAMDRQNLTDLQILCPQNFDGELALFLDYAGDLEDKEVPDPYYNDRRGEGFVQVLAMIEQASDGLLTHILRRHRL